MRNIILLWRKIKPDRFLKPVRFVVAILLLMTTSGIMAQQVIDTANFTIKGSFLYVQPGTQLYIDGTINNLHNDFIWDATPDGDINNLDTIFSAGDFANQIPQPLFSSPGTVYLRYDFPQNVRYDTLNFENLIVNKSHNRFSLRRDISVTGQLLLIKGNIDMVNSKLDLRNTGYLLGETNTSRILGEKGWLIARNRLLNPPFDGEPAGMGLRFKPADALGITTFMRRNDIQNNAADGSINRIFDIFPNSDGITDITMRYFDDECENIPGILDLTTLGIWRSEQTGVDESDDYVKMSPSLPDPLQNKVGYNNLELLSSGVRITAADTVCDNPPRFPNAPAVLRMCPGESIELDAGTEAAMWLWSFNNANTQKIQIDWTDISDGRDTIEVFIEAINGCSNTREYIIELYPQPEANFATHVSYCEGEQINYQNLSSINPSQGLTYQWLLPDGSISNSENPVYQLEETGTVYATLIVTSAYNCRDTVTKSTQVYPFPEASFVANHLEVCESELISLTNTSTTSTGTISQSMWYFDDGFYSELTGLNALDLEMKAYQNWGSYTISLRVTTDNNCSDSTSTLVYVNAKPYVDFSIPAGSQVNVPSQFSNLTSLATSGSLGYIWNFGDGSALSTQKNPAHTYTSVNVYEVKLIAESSKGCVDSLKKNIEVTSPPLAGFSHHADDYCFGNTVSFTNTSYIPGGGTMSYLWTFGDGTSSTQENPTKLYNNHGTYTVKLVVTATSGLTNAYQQNITIHPVPQASFVPPAVCFGAASVFQNTSAIAAGSMTYDWDFGDISLGSTESSPSHSYNAWNQYTVTLIATSDLGCKDTATAQTMVNPIPVAAFAVDDICLGEMAMITNLSTIANGTYSSSWSFGDGNSSNLQNPSHQFTTASGYTISLVVNSNAGCTASTHQSINVYPNPIADFTATTACEGNTTSFTNNSYISSGSITYQWSFGTGDFSTDSNPEYTYPNANAYNVQLTANSNHGCSSVKSVLINVYPFPTPEFNFTNVCLGAPVSFVNQSSILATGSEAELNYIWDFGNGQTSLALHPTYTYSSDGTYTVNLKAVSPFGCHNSIEKEVTIYPIPVSSFTAANACRGEDVNFVNNSSITSGSINYWWNFNDGTTANDELPTKAFNMAKTHYVDLEVTSEFGCTHTSSGSLVVYHIPTVQFTHPTEVCEGASFIFNNTSFINSGTLTYNWDFGDTQSSSLKSPAHSYSATGDYTVQLTATSGSGCTTEKTSSIHVKPTPVAGFTSEIAHYGASTQFTNTSNIEGSTPLSYTWLFGDGNHSTQENPSHIYNFEGNYNVSLVAASNKSCSDTISQLIAIPIPEVANFNFSGSLCENANLNFNDQSYFPEGGSLSYFWDFGDGTTSNQQHPQKSFAAAGTYPVSLTVTPSVGNPSNSTQNLEIYYSPVASFSVQNVCLNESVSLVNTSQYTGAVSFAWSLGDGSISDEENPTHQYSNAAIYSITLEVNTAEGCGNAVEMPITVYPVPDINISDTLTTCTSSLLIDAGNAGASYHWLPNAENTQTIVAENEGMYIVTLTDGNNCIMKDSVYVVLNTPLLVNLGTNGNFCEAQQLDAGYANATYLWSDNSSSRYLTPQASGTYSVTVTDQNACVGSGSITINIIDSPQLDLGNDTSICQGSVVILDAANTGSQYLWSNGAVTQNLTASMSGNYSVTVTHPNGCRASDAINLSVSPVPIANFSFPAGSLCVGQNITLNNTSAIASGVLYYEWNLGDGNMSNNAHPSHIYATHGSYQLSLTATSENACSSVKNASIVLRAIPQPDFSWVPAYNAPTSFTNLTNIADSSNMAYNWSFGDGFASTQKNPLHTYSYNGVYQVKLTATSVFGCAANIQQNVSIVPPQDIDFTFNGTRCAGSLVEFSDNSSLPYGGTLSYSWDFGDGTTSSQKNPSKSYNTAGVYPVKLTVTPAIGSAEIIMKSVEIYETPVASFNIPNVCQNDTVHFVNTTTGKTGASMYWNFGDGSVSSEFEPLKVFPQTGSYTISLVVVSPNFCTSTATVNQIVHALPLVNLSDTIRTCSHEYLLDIGNIGSQYLWSSGATTTQTFLVETDGNYSVTVTNNEGCSASDNVFVELNTVLTVNLGNDGDYCIGRLLDAGYPGGEYLWSDGSTERFLAVAATGDYAVTVTDMYLCTGIDSINILVLDSPEIALGNDTVVCSHDNLVLDAQNTGAFYQWSNANISQTIEINTSGLYAVTVTNANGCFVTDKVHITVNPSPQSFVTDSMYACFGNTPYIIDAGNAGSQYIWNTGESTQTIETTAGGMYFVTITNSYGCVLTDSVYFGINTIPVVSLPDTLAICANSFVEIDAGNQGSNYLWSNGTNTQTAAVNNEGYVYVTVTDINHCSASDSTMIIMRPAPIVDFGSNMVVCENQIPVVLDAQSLGATYLWSDGSTESSLHVAATGMYAVTVSNGIGCEAIDSVHITINPSPVVYLGNDTVICQGSSIVFDAQNSGSYYEWSNGNTQQSITAQHQGIYSVIVTNQYNCSTQSEIALGVNATPTLNLGPDRVVCSGEIVTLNGGNQQASYQWSNGQTEQIIQVTSTGVYSVTLTDFFGCTNVDTVNVTVNPIPTQEFGQDLGTCSHVVLNAGNPGATYLWSNNATTQTINVNSSGIYVVLIQNEYNCINRDTIEVTVHPTPIVNLGPDTSICHGQTFTFNAGNPGSLFVWSNGVYSQLNPVSEQGMYKVRVINQFGCESSDSVYLSVKPLPQFTLGNDIDKCEGAFAVLNPGAVQGTYLWSNGATDNTIMVNASGQYALTITNTYGCSSADTVRATFHANPIVNLGNDTSICGMLTLNAGNLGSSYIWSNQQTSQQISVTQSGNYWVRVISAYGCSSWDTISVTILPSPIIELGPTIYACDGDIISLTVSGNAENIQWSNGSTADTIWVAQSGIHSVTAWNANGCQAYDDVTVMFHPTPILSFENEYTICENMPLQLAGQSPNNIYQWRSDNGFMATTREVTIQNPGKYWLIETSAMGCSAVDTFKVTMSPYTVYAQFLATSQIKEGDTVKFVNLSYPKPYSSFWSFGDGLISIDAHPLHTFYSSGAYQVSLTVKNEACKNTMTKMINAEENKIGEIPQGPRREAEKQSYFVSANLYPNPNKGSFLVEAKLAVKADMHVDFYDLSGRLLDLRHIKNVDIFHQVYQFENLAPGMYILRIVVKDERKSFKVIIY